MTMVIGDISNFAIESDITQAYERPNFCAVGYFVLHIGGLNYGVREPDATLLGSAFHEAGRRIADRGKHIAPFASEPNAGDIVDAIGTAVYAPDSENRPFFGLSKERFRHFVYSSRCGWHWACSEAFDDGSDVLHFDIGTRVRLIADRSPRENCGYRHDLATLRDVWLEADVFYDVLQTWRDDFEAEWVAASKISQSDDERI